MVRSHVETVTVEKAKKYLSKNIINRRVRISAVNQYSDIMKRGSWELTHQGIAFNDHGMLIDGQHRLNAIIDSGVAVKMMVTVGLDHDSFKELPVDSGIKRSFSDQYKKPRKAAALVSFIAKIGLSSGMVANDVIATFYSVFGPYAEMLFERCNTSARYYSSAAMQSGAVLWLFIADDGDEGFGEYILSQYRALVLQEYQDMSPKIMAIAKHYNGKDGFRRYYDRHEVLCRSFDAFNPAKQNETKTYISTMYKEKNLVHIRSIIKSAMMGKF